MMISIELGPEFDQTVEKLGSMGKAVLLAASKGLGQGVKYAASNVSRNFLSGQSLVARTGNLRRAVQGWLVEPLEGAVGVQANAAVSKYAWLLTDEEKTIVPVRAKALTIPIGEALTGAGVPRFESVKDAERQLGTKLFRLPGTNVLGYKRGKKGKFRALFALAAKVIVQGSGGLYDGVLDSVDEITGTMKEKISEAIGE
jgi:hypothetical protein